MTDLINSLEALAWKVTPGDWAVGPYYIGTGPDEVMRGMILTDGGWPTGIICENDPPCGDTLSLDLDLICLLRNNLPTIIAALKVAELVRDEDWLVDQIRDYFPAEELAVGEHIAAAREIIAAMGEEVK